MAYQEINIPGRKPATQIDVEFEEPKEDETPKTKEIKVPEEAPKEPEIKEELEIPLDSQDEDEDDEDEKQEPEIKEPAESKSKKKVGRPKGSTNKKRDKRIQQLLEQRDKEKQKAREAEARLQEMEKRMFESSKASTESRKKTLEQTLESLQSQLKNAIEEDDAATIVDIQNKMMQANMEYAAVNYEYENSPKEYQAPAQKQEDAPEASPYAMDWIDEHPEFKEDEEFHAAALGVNAKLLKMGFDPETPEFYEQLDKRLSKRYPEYFDISEKDVVQYREDEDDDSSDSDETDIPQTVAGASRTPSGSTSGSTKSGRKTKNTVILTEEDQILCQKWNIDPVAFAKRKKALEGKGKGDYTDIK